MPTACNNNLYSYKELEEEHVLILVASSEFLDFIVFFSIYNTFSCLKFILFNWRIIALQCCVAFCHTSTWISHRYKHVPSLLSLPPISIPLHPSRLSQSTGLSSLGHRANSHWLSVFHKGKYIFPCYSVSSSHPLLLPLCPQVCFLYLRLHCSPASRFICAIFQVMIDS